MDAGRNSAQFAHTNASRALIWTQMWSPTIFDLIFDPIHFQIPPALAPLGWWGGFAPSHTPPEFLGGLRSPKPPPMAASPRKVGEIGPREVQANKTPPPPNPVRQRLAMPPRGPKGRRCCNVVATCCNVVATLLRRCCDVVATLLRRCCDVVATLLRRC